MMIVPVNTHVHETQHVTEKNGKKGIVPGNVEKEGAALLTVSQ
jgi:hypothetical protein